MPQLARTPHMAWRGLREGECAAIAWLGDLEPGARERALSALRVSWLQPGGLACHQGQQPLYWLGIIDGLLRMNACSMGGAERTLLALPSGGWFGEGTLLKGEAYRYDVQALRKSLVAALPAAHFAWLLDHSIAFNRFVMQQLNERLGKFIAAREIDLLHNPDLRVARSLVTLFHPLPRVTAGRALLRITQGELACLVGLSRQRVNQALARLERAGALQVQYRSLLLLDLPALRQGMFGMA